MTLDQYLTENGITEAVFAAMIGTSQPNVHRLRNGQVPGKELMTVIFEKTDGKVRADDFYGLDAA